jgi:hypothetical protein
MMKGCSSLHIACDEGFRHLVPLEATPPSTATTTAPRLGQANKKAQHYSVDQSQNVDSATALSPCRIIKIESATALLPPNYFRI